MRQRALMMLCILVGLLLAFASLGHWLWPRWEASGNVLDLTLCYLTLSTCPFMSTYESRYWNELLILNGVVFVFWLPYMAALYGCVMGRTATGQIVGGVLATLIVLLGFSLITLTLLLQGLRFG